MADANLRFQPILPQAKSSTIHSVLSTCFFSQSLSQTLGDHEAPNKPRTADRRRDTANAADAEKSVKQEPPTRTHTVSRPASPRSSPTLLPCRLLPPARSDGLTIGSRRPKYHRQIPLEVEAPGHSQELSISRCSECRGACATDDGNEDKGHPRITSSVFTSPTDSGVRTTNLSPRL
ncbi:hypothetical protein CONLIGDRAFT_225160 [Coniochaeta ligniaria NRRL 30616]|uniref:Uncharacterized protein n=1 Tax=Coniochaeta ligniaria NRRL 30616 TaxID=1408157 RepID=A0A1J7I4P2_9PEZI|nr:hypothetical protein CONLIGDRAFT_225160 [Coniochaeta ligniaria NRRL 30616]